MTEAMSKSHNFPIQFYKTHEKKMSYKTLVQDFHSKSIFI